MKPVLAASAALAALAFPLLAPTPRAEACSPPLPDATPILPAHGSFDVPTNAKVWVRLVDSFDLSSYRVTLRAAGGAEAALTGDEAPGESHWDGVLVLTPEQPLAPGTAYEVLDNLARPCTDFGDACVTDTPAVVLTFTTGTGPDTTAPDAPSDLVLTTYDRWICEDSGCCGPYDAMTYSLSWQPGTDGNPVVHALRAADSGSLIATGLGARVGGAVACGPSEHAPNFERWFGATPVVVQAIDIAGNVTDSAPFDVQVSCEGDGDRDAGPWHCDGGHPGPTPDAGTAPADPADLPTGCMQIAPGTAARHGGSAVGLVFGLAVTFVSLRRRARRPR